MAAAASAPRLTWGMIASVALHVAAIAAFVLARPKEVPMPPVYRVQLIAAPPGERAIGAVQPKAPVSPPVEKPPPPTPAKPAPKTTKAPTPKAKTTSVPKQATPTPPVKAAQPEKPTPQPTAGGGPTGGKGADVANVDTPGIEFPYPWYTAQIVRQMIKYFGTSNSQLEATVRFTIRRDGTIDPESIHMVTPSRDYSFNQKVLGTVEAVMNAKPFQALPSGYQEDILPVTFRFSPSLNK